MKNPSIKMLELYKAGFRQAHESTCGPASVILSTQVLGLDIRQESDWIDIRFEKYFPVGDFLERGMALHELHFISEMLYSKNLEIIERRAYQENYSLFVEDLIQVFNTGNAVIIVNYKQVDFVANLTHCPLGHPHYSPVAHCDVENNKILIADIDFNVSEPYWVTFQEMFKSMSDCHPVFNIPRGWLILKRREA
jgi:hypothetical protein